MQGGEHFCEQRTASLERFADRALVFIERLQSRLACGNTLLDHAHARGGIDQLLIQFPPVAGDGVDLLAQLGFRFEGFLAFGLQRLVFLVTL